MSSELYFAADSPDSLKNSFVGFMGNISGVLACFDDSRFLKDNLFDFKEPVELGHCIQDF